MTRNSVTTSESSASARVDPQAYTEPLTNGRDDPDKFSHECRLKAKWVNVAMSFGIKLQDLFKLGMRLSEDYDSVSDVDDDEKAVLFTAYKDIIKFIPELKKLLPVNGGGDAEKLYKVLDNMQKGSSAARSDAFKRVNQFTDRYLNSGTRPIQCDARTMAKSLRGLNHPQIGRLIIPADKVAEWDEDPERSRALINAGEDKILGCDMPIFLYHEYQYDPDNADGGLFRSAFLVCVLVDILYGPQAVDTEGAKRSEHHRHYCVGDMYDAKSITPQMIAYSAVVARFALSSMDTWNIQEDNFDYRTFYRMIITQLSDPLDPWADETLRWWNVQVFGNEKGKTPAINKDSREQEVREKFAQRKAARKARNSVNSNALSARATTPDSFGTPVNEDYEYIAHQLSRPNSPGNMIPSYAGGGSAIHNTPSSALAPVIDPALLHVSRVTHPINSGLTQTQYRMPTPPNSSPSAVHTMPSSTLAPVIDPALLRMTHVTHPNNSGLTQTQYPMPTPPDPHMSGPEREPSPLSSPPDEETSTTEPVDAPSSCTRKRKAAKNNTGKGKAPPKQRRKTAEARAARI